MQKQPQIVMGHVIPAPRITNAGIRLMVMHVGLPLLSALVLFDAIVWAAGRLLFDTCIGLWCWL